MTYIRLLFSIATIHRWTPFQFDIKNAFLHDDLDKEVYMEQPPEFVSQGDSHDLVCHLHGSLYGLKQSLHP